jgi:hypothetical protein
LQQQRLTVSDAIGLITLRLGVLEQWKIDKDNDPPSTSSTQAVTDSTALITLLHRIEALEKDKLEHMNQSKAEITASKQFRDTLVKYSMDLSNVQQQLYSLQQTLQQKWDTYDTALLELEASVLVQHQGETVTEPETETKPETKPETETEAVVLPVEPNVVDLRDALRDVIIS